MIKQLKDFEGIVLLKQDGTGWEDTLYLYAVDIPSLNIKQCGALIMSKYYVQSILNLQAPLDRMIPVYPIDYRTEQNFKGTEIEKQKNLKRLSEKEFLERLEKSRKQSKNGKEKDADTAIKEIRKKYNL